MSLFYELNLEHGRQSVESFSALLSEMYRTGDSSHIAPYVTPQLLAVYERELVVLEHYGLTKRVTYSDHEAYDSKTDADLKARGDGKYSEGLGLRFAAYQEDFFDRAGNLVETIKHGRTKTQLSAIRTKDKHLADHPHEINCSNCGAHVEIQTTETTCGYCGATYLTEAYNWLVSSFYNMDDSRTFLLSDIQKGIVKIGGTMFVAGGVTFAVAGVLTLLFGNTAIGPILELVIKGAGILIALGAVSFFLLFLASFVGLFAFLAEPLFMFSKWRRRKRVQAKDRNFSMAGLQLLGQSLLDRHPDLIDEDLDDNVAVLSDGVVKQFVGDYSVDDQYEYMQVMLEYLEKRFAYRGKRVSIEQKRRKLTLPLVRLLGVKTPVYYEPTQYTCTSCGSHEPVINATVQECSYCGNARRLVEMDWVLVQ